MMAVDLFSVIQFLEDFSRMDSDNFTFVGWKSPVVDPDSYGYDSYGSYEEVNISEGMWVYHPNGPDSLGVAFTLNHDGKITSFEPELKTPVRRISYTWE